MSPWHDIEMDSSIQGDNYVTGVTEITVGTSKKFEVTKTLPFNPIMQDTIVNKNTLKRQHRVYSRPPKFGYGFIPQTWCDDDLGGDADALDLVDLSWKELKPILAVSDYLILGIFGLVDQGALDYKILGMEANEANERGVKTL
jgi:inorganic pyrophosphatase